MKNRVGLFLRRLKMVNTHLTEVIETKKKNLIWWKSDGGGCGIYGEQKERLYFKKKKTKKTQRIGQKVLVPGLDFFSETLPDLFQALKVRRG